MTDTIDYTAPFAPYGQVELRVSPLIFIIKDCR